MTSARAEWLIERGIGEDRALLVEGDRVLAAKLRWPGELHAGRQVDAKLTTKRSGARRGTATLADGTKVLVDHLPPELTEGTGIALSITRAAIAERGRFKRAQARFSGAGKLPAIDDAYVSGKVVARFPASLWEDVWHSASARAIEFVGGEILVSSTPAMTVIDIDGEGSAREVALAAIPAIAQALRWFDIGGSVGIDFPTIETKADRKAIDEALESALADWPHERTAMNGFGFVQLVARLAAPSLLHRFESSRVGMCARLALRQGELAEGTGTVLLLTVHPALKPKLKTEWLEELQRRTGRKVRIATDPALALEAPQAQVLSD